MEVAIPKRIFTTMSVSVFFFNTDCCRAPPDPPRLQDRATPAPHGSTRCYPRKNGRQHQTRQAGGVEGSPPGTACSVPGKGADPRGRCFHHSRRHFPPEIFSRPLLGVSIERKAYSPTMEHYHLPGVIFHIPG